MKKINYDYLSTQISLPFEGANYKVIKLIFEKLSRDFNLSCGSNQKFIDLGSGDGRVVIYCGLHFKIRSVGIELNYTLIKEAKDALKRQISSKNYKKRFKKYAKFKLKDIFTQGLNDFDYIYIFPLPTMTKYLEHVFKTLKKDAILISYKYPIINCEEIITLVEDYEFHRENKSIHAYFYKKVESS